MFKKLIFVFAGTLLISCSKEAVPKPSGELRLEYPAPKYKPFVNSCSYTFEYSDFAEITNAKKPCWFYLTYPKMKAKVFLTYYPINNDFDLHIKEAEKMVYEHTIKASSIETKSFAYPERNVFGNFYEDWKDGNPAYDSTKEFAVSCGKMGRPVFIRFAHEMNGSWYPWCVWMDKNKNTVYDKDEETGHTPENYRTAFRNVSGMFKKYAPNAAVIWCPNHGWLGSERKDNYTGFYPGDEYVDWVGLDFYERGWTLPGMESKIWGGLFTYGLTHDSLDDMSTPENESVNFYKVYCEEKQKPLMICETGATLTYRDDLTGEQRRELSHEWKGGKWNPGEYGWIMGVYGTSQLKTNKHNYNIDAAFPKLKAIIWFNQAKREDVPVEINRFMEGEFSDAVGYGPKKTKWFDNGWCDYRVGNNSVDESTKHDIKYSSEAEIKLYRELTGVEYFKGEFASGQTYKGER